MENKKINLTPPICAGKGERHPQWVALTLPVELPHGGGDTDEISEADRVQYECWSVVAHVRTDNEMTKYFLFSMSGSFLYVYLIPNKNLWRKARWYPLSVC